MAQRLIMIESDSQPVYRRAGVYVARVSVHLGAAGRPATTEDPAITLEVDLDGSWTLTDRDTRATVAQGCIA